MYGADVVCHGVRLGLPGLSRLGENHLEGGGCGRRLTPQRSVKPGRPPGPQAPPSSGTGGRSWWDAGVRHQLGGSSWSRVLSLAVVAALLWSEWATWRGSRQAIPAGRLDPRCTEPGEVVLVLGCRPGRGGRLSLMQRWRTRIAVRSTDVLAARFVFSGAATRGGRSEASLMAGYAVTALGVPPENVVLEECARSTWENIAFSIPVIDGAPAIKIASNTFHARRARGYLAQQSPGLACRLRRARDYVPGELCLVKPLLGLYEWRRSRRERRERRDGRRGARITAHRP